MKNRNAAQGRSPAVERPAETEAQLLARFRRALKDSIYAEKAEEARHYFSSSSGEAYVLALSLSGETDLSPQLQEAYSWANLRMYENPAASLQTISAALPKISKSSTHDRDWAVSVLTDLGQKTPSLRREIRTALLQEVNRQGIQSLEGMTTLVKVLRIQRDQEWVNEVRKEFEEMNPGSDLGEVVALRKQ